MRRRDFIIFAALAALPLRARAQTLNLPVVGFLHPGFRAFTGPTSSFDQTKEGLRKIGQIDGETVRLEPRWGEGKTEALPALAMELVRLKPAVIVAVGRPSIEAARAATKELPIVALDLESDPVASGYVASWAAPGGNITGLFLDLPSLTAKWLQLITDVVPAARQIAVLWDVTTGESQLRALSAAVKAKSLDLQVLEFRNAATMESVLATGLEQKPHALIQLGSPLINQLGNRIAEIVSAHNTPSISQFRSFAEGGGLMSYGPVLPAWFRALAPYVSAILKGAKPAAMPVEQPINFELVVNAKAAALLGVKIPQPLLLGADLVIE
jgi:putative ABC transport system substrate-binding protein